MQRFQKFKFFFEDCPSFSDDVCFPVYLRADFSFLFFFPLLPPPRCWGPVVAKCIIHPWHFMSGTGKNVDQIPNQQLTLNNLPTELKKFLVNNHRLSIQIGTKQAKTCMQCLHVPTELPFCIPPLVVGHDFSVCFTIAEAQIQTPSRYLFLFIE